MAVTTSRSRASPLLIPFSSANSTSTVSMSAGTVTDSLTVSIFSVSM